MMRSRFLPSAYSRPDEIQIASPFTEAKISHQPSARASISMPLACCQMASACSRGIELARTLAVGPAPQRIERPCEVLDRVAEMTHLPVEDGADAPLGVEQEVARAVIAVHDREPPRRRRRIAAEPANRRARDRLRGELVLVDHPLPIVELAPPATLERGCLELRREIRGIATRDLAEDPPLLLADGLDMVDVGRLREQPPVRNGVDDLLHDEKRPVEPARVRLEEERARDGHPRAVKRLIRVILGRAVGLDETGRWVTSQDQSLLAFPAAFDGTHGHAIRLARRAAVDALEGFDFDARRLRPAMLRDRRRSERRDHSSVGAHRAPSRSSRRPEGSCGPRISCSSTPTPSFVRPFSRRRAPQKAWTWRWSG